MLFVCAAGNNSKDISLDPFYPACFELSNIISVAAMDNQGKLAAFSSYGGKNSVAALVKSYLPDMTAFQIAERLKLNITESTELKDKVASGGRINATEALTGVSPESDGNPVNSDEINGDINNKDIILSAQVDISPELQKQIHFGEDGMNPATGNFSRSYTDFTMPSPGFQVNISRVYNSKDDRISSLMGRGWTFGFEGSLNKDPVYTHLWIARLPDGSAQVFVKNADNTYTANDSR